MSGHARYRRRLIIMAKAPVMGGVKTRLARDIGAVSAVRLYRHLLANTLARLGADPRWQTILAVAPDAAVASRAFPAAIARVGQGRGDLGARMQRLLSAAPPGPAILIGTDIPCVTPAMIAEAFRGLERGDAVFGPAEDGGFWLVGLARTRRIASPFVGVRWSSETTLAETLAHLQGARVHFAAGRTDLDTAADLALHTGPGRPDLGRRITPGRSPSG